MAKFELYNYFCESEKLLFQVVRLYPKKFYQRRWDNKKKEWIYNLHGVRKVLYRLPEVMKADVVFIVEGEKDVHTLEELGLVATTCPGGSNSWKDEYNEYFKNKEVIIIPDNDDAGKQFAKTVARGLFPYATTVKILNKIYDLYKVQDGSSNIYTEIPRPRGYDITDWIIEGHNLDDLMKFVNDSGSYITLKELEKQEPELKEKPINIKNGNYTNGNGITKEMIEQALQYPIEKIIDVDKSGKAFCINPEHKDEHKSLDTRRNFAYCYGCGFHGSVIDVAKIIYNCDFKTAVKKINGNL